ncbi:MAG: GNAT family N-acetyltransferase [Deltaproteobacteria bacterium]
MPETTSTIPDQPLAVAGPDEWARFCTAPGFAPASRAALSRQRPDALWMLVRQDQSVSARCALWWEQTPSHAGHRVGLIGHYAARDALAATRLLELACGQLAARGCTLAVGPMDGSTWQNYRLIVERGTERPFFMEPDHPDEWPGHFLDNGFTVLARYYSALNSDLSQQDRGLTEVLHRVESLGIGVRQIVMENLEEELTAIHGLTIDCFRDAFLFTPVRREDFLAQYLELQTCVRPELILLARQAARLVGFIFAVPDLLRARRGPDADTVIIKTLAVHPDFRGTGLGRVLAARCHKAARELGYRRAIHALMLDTSAARTISDRIARPMRRYALFARTLENIGP